VNPAAEAAIGAGDGVLAPYHPGEVEDAVGDDLRVLYDVGGVTDDARDQDFSVGQLDVSPDFPLVLVPDVAGLDRVRPTRTLSRTSTMFRSGRSVVCGPCQLPQHMWQRIRSSGRPRRAWLLPK